MYSALKVNGKKLCDLAREGVEVERKARKVQILDIAILSIDLPRVTMRVHCSKGTYIRTLCHDIGEKLGCGACMEYLVRTRVSDFQIEEAKTLQEIETIMKSGKIEEILYPIDTVFKNLPQIHSRKDSTALLYNGNKLPLPVIAEAEYDRGIRLLLFIKKMTAKKSECMTMQIILLEYMNTVQRTGCLSR